MAYTDQLTQHIIAQAASLNSLADIGNWAPGLCPVRIIAVGVLIGNDVAAAGVVKFDKRPVFGSDAGRGDGDIAVINLTTAHVAGKDVYKGGLNIKLSPGEQLVVEVTDVTGAGDVADIWVAFYPEWEMPGNIAAMVATT